jgi:hypothetical protein
VRHVVRMKAVLCLPLVLASYASADEAADRVSIARAIAGLNELPHRAALFNDDAFCELARLPDVNPRSFRILEPQGYPSSSPQADGPTVTISHEPWGEATITFPGVTSLQTLEILNPRIANRAVRFITPDVALADGDWTYDDSSGSKRTVPILFVMKKEGDDWKIASLHVLTPH